MAEPEKREPKGFKAFLRKHGPVLLVLLCLVSVVMILMARPIPVVIGTAVLLTVGGIFAPKDRKW